MREPIAGVVLAGGLSRRMGGGDKGLLALDGRLVLDRVVSRLTPQVARLALNANGDPGRFSHLRLPVVADTIPGFAGPLAGLLAGLEWAAAETRCGAMVSVAADTPFLPPDLVERLAAATADNPGVIAVASSNGRRHPTFALWPLTLRGALDAALAQGERRVSAFIERQRFVEVGFSMAQIGGRIADPFFNINTPADMDEAERMLGGDRQ